MIVKFAKLHADAKIPSQARPGDGGLDLTAIKYEYISKVPVPYHNYEFGLSVEIPTGWVGLIFPRSSISNKDLMLTNCVGVIDSGYRGSLSARFKAIKETNQMSVYEGVVSTPPTEIYKVGERVAQLVLVPCPVVYNCIEVPYEELSKTERGTGGFGSSGN